MREMCVRLASLELCESLAVESVAVVDGAGNTGALQSTKQDTSLVVGGAKKRSFSERCAR